jgi:hypothetical protein
MGDSPNHHSVSQGYLKAFNDGQGIIVYDTTERTLPELLRQIRDPRIETKVKCLAAEIDYNTRETKNGPDDSFEQMLWPFENDYPRVRKAVRSRQPLSDEQLDSLARFAGAQSARVNRMVLVDPMQQNREQAAAVIRQFKPEMTEEQISEMTDAMSGDLVNTDVPPTPKNIALDAVPLMIDFDMDMFRFMFKSIVYSNAREFVTSDAPVVFVDPARFPVPQRSFPRLSETIEVTFPLYRRACLVMAWQPLRSQFQADEAMVSTINARTANHSRKHVFATNTGAQVDRNRNARDFHDMAVRLGTPLASALAREEPATEEETARYRHAMATLGIPPEMARGEVEAIGSRFALPWLHAKKASRNDWAAKKPSADVGAHRGRRPSQGGA